jgi:hypothetical protein
MKNFAAFILIIGCLISCNKVSDGGQEDNTDSHLQYFGFVLIDTYWDDPTDSEAKTNYADEVHSFSNLADLLVANPADDITNRVQSFSDFDMKAVLHFNELFFELGDTNSSSGANYDLKTDYEERWNQFESANQAILNTDHIGAFYVGEEPVWNGISYSELKTVTAFLKSHHPAIPIMIIEAYPALNDLRVPTSADWIGFDYYFIKNPNTSSTFQ